MYNKIQEIQNWIIWFWMPALLEYLLWLLIASLHMNEGLISSFQNCNTFREVVQVSVKPSIADIQKTQ